MGVDYFLCPKCKECGPYEEQGWCLKCKVNFCCACKEKGAETFGDPKKGVPEEEVDGVDGHMKECWFCTEDPAFRVFEEAEVGAFLVAKHDTTMEDVLGEMKAGLGGGAAPGARFEDRIEAIVSADARTFEALVEDLRIEDLVEECERAKVPHSRRAELYEAKRRILDRKIGDDPRAVSLAEFAAFNQTWSDACLRDPKECRRDGAMGWRYKLLEGLSNETAKSICENALERKEAIHAASRARNLAAFKTLFEGAFPRAEKKLELMEKWFGFLDSLEPPRGWADQPSLKTAVLDALKEMDPDEERAEEWALEKAPEGMRPLLKKALRKRKRSPE